MTKEDAKILKILGDLPLFAYNFLKIVGKSGKVCPFDFNSAQTYLHERLENQLRVTGKVRALVLKGRQQGVSTYTQGRFFHKVATQVGKKAFILSHKSDTTKSIFEMTKRFYDSMPPGIIPTADYSSSKELTFKSLDSGYSVGTAGNKGVGRGQTTQLFHGSEVAFWENAAEHAQGVLQSVSEDANTEIILESTANGIGNYFYDMWQNATMGKNDFQAIFIPWYWQIEYTAQPSENETVTLTDEEEKLLSYYAHDGLTVNHLYWMRKKLASFSIDPEESREKFLQEYPFTAVDAFRNPIKDRFINSPIVMQARKQEVNSSSPLVIGVDPAIGDGDRSAIIRRKGRLAYNLETHYNLNTMELVGTIRRIIDTEKPVKVCIDCIGIGAGIVDRLIELGYSCVEGVNVARTANCHDKFKNLRAELWHDLKEWLSGEMPVQIPDSDELLGDLTSLGYKFDSSGRLQIESKEALKKRGMKSPDTADALALTFAVGDYMTSTAFTTNYLPDKSAGMFI